MACASCGKKGKGGTMSNGSGNYTKMNRRTSASNNSQTTPISNAGGSTKGMNMMRGSHAMPARKGRM